MNIQGFKLLLAYNYPTPAFSSVFRTPTELNWKTIKPESPEVGFHLIGFDDNSSIYDHPFQITSFRLSNIRVDQINDAWTYLSSELSNAHVNKEDQIFYLARQFNEFEILYWGMTNKILDENWFGRIALDLRYKTRPSSQDWQPDYSMTLPINGGRRDWSIAKKEYYSSKCLVDDYVIAKIIKAIWNIPVNAHLDFVIFYNARITYHDLCFL